MSSTSSRSGTPAATDRTTADTTADDSRSRPSVGTIVWGLMIVALAVLIMLAQVAGFTVDPGQLIIGLLIGAGFALVIGGLLSARNRRKDDKQPYHKGN